MIGRISDRSAAINLGEEKGTLTFLIKAKIDGPTVFVEDLNGVVEGTGGQHLAILGVGKTHFPNGTTVFLNYYYFKKATLKRRPNYLTNFFVFELFQFIAGP